MNFLDRLQWRSFYARRMLAIHFIELTGHYSSLTPRKPLTNVNAPQNLNGKSPEVVDSFRRMNAFGRLGEKEDIANALELLVSDRAHWITGQTIRINGRFN
nr:SDR family oxidoreductase [Paenibacillus massiliensis]